MDNSDNDIKHYSAEDIARYWQGKLSAKEMHAMEKAAMDDPFLADALEGYSNASSAAVATDIQTLQHRLKERVSAPVVPLKRDRKWWSVAALLILLCGVGAMAYIFLINPDKSNAGMAIVTQKDSPAVAEQKWTSDSLPSASSAEANNAAALKGTDTVAMSGSVATLHGQKEEAEKTNAGNTDGWAATADKPGAEYKPTTPNVQARTRSNVGDTAGYRSDNISRENVYAKKEAQRNESAAVTDNNARRNAGAPADTENRVANVQRNYSDSQVYGATRNDNDQQRGLVFNNFSGRVLDRNNAPVPFASVRSNNTQITAADHNGNFQFRSFDSVLNLSVSSVGFEVRQLTARNNQPVDVVLEQNKSKLSEVVVSGYGTQKKSVSKPKPSDLKVYVMDAEPVVGWDEFNKYIEKNKIVDAAYQRKEKNADTTAGKREVVVSFTVNKNGKLSNFNIEKSLGKQEDAEAIRLIKEGPAWRATKDKKTRARVIIPF